MAENRKRQTKKEKDDEKIRTKALKEAILQALERNLGVVASACQSLGIGRGTFYRYMNSDKKFAEAVEEIKCVSLDFAESALFSQIKKGNTAAIIFYLKTQGKDRGYVSRKEVTGADGSPLVPATLTVSVTSEKPITKESDIPEDI